MKINRFKFLVTGSIFIALLVFSIQTGSAANYIGLLYHKSNVITQRANTTLKTFSSYANQFSIGYPANWTKLTLEGFAFAALDESTSNNLTILVLNNENMSLEEVTQINLAETKRNIPNLEVLEESSGVISDKPYTLTETKFYNPTIPGMQYTALYCFVENRNAYIVTFATEYSAKQNLKILMNEIIKTIKFN